MLCGRSKASPIDGQLFVGPTYYVVVFFVLGSQNNPSKSFLPHPHTKSAKPALVEQPPPTPPTPSFSSIVRQVSFYVEEPIYVGDIIRLLDVNWFTRLTSPDHYCTIAIGNSFTTKAARAATNVYSVDKRH